MTQLRVYVPYLAEYPDESHRPSPISSLPSSFALKFSVYFINSREEVTFLDVFILSLSNKPNIWKIKDF